MRNNIESIQTQSQTGVTEMLSGISKNLRVRLAEIAIVSSVLPAILLYACSNNGSSTNTPTPENQTCALPPDSTPTFSEGRVISNNCFEVFLRGPSIMPYIDTPSPKQVDEITNTMKALFLSYTRYNLAVLDGDQKLQNIDVIYRPPNVGGERVIVWVPEPAMDSPGYNIQDILREFGRNNSKVEAVKPFYLDTHPLNKS